MHKSPIWVPWLSTSGHTLAANQRASQPSRFPPPLFIFIFIFVFTYIFISIFISIFILIFIFIAIFTYIFTFFFIYIFVSHPHFNTLFSGCAR